MWRQESYPPASDFHLCYYFNYLKFKKAFFTSGSIQSAGSMSYWTNLGYLSILESVTVVGTMDYADWSALGHMISPVAGSWGQSHPNHTDKDWR